MGTPPQLTPEQRVAALAKASTSRKRRADIKSQKKDRVGDTAGDVQNFEVLAQ